MSATDEQNGPLARVESIDAGKLTKLMREMSHPMESTEALG